MAEAADVGELDLSIVAVHIMPSFPQGSRVACFEMVGGLEFPWLTITCSKITP
jgi:hypothetical protein